MEVDGGTLGNRSGLKVKGMITAMIIFGVFAILSALVVAVLYICGNQDPIVQRMSIALGFVSTIISIILSVVATIYSFKSGIKTAETLDAIKEQYSTFSTEINRTRNQDALGKSSTERITKK